MPTAVDAIQEKLSALTQTLEATLDADVLGIFGPILSGVEHRVRAAIERLAPRRGKLAVVIQTGGGSIEVAERIVRTIRHHFNEVVFLIPDVALSAGTILVMSGDAILMDYFSCLGPMIRRLSATANSCQHCPIWNSSIGSWQSRPRACLRLQNYPCSISSTSQSFTRLSRR